MKKVAVILSTVIMILGVTGVALATLYNEEYSGHQNVRQGEFYNFGFDLWFENDSSDPVLSQFVVDTNSNLELGKDSVGAQGEYQWAALHIDFFSVDAIDKNIDITISAWDSFQNEAGSFKLDTFHWNGNGQNGMTFHFSYNFTPAQVDLFQKWGWGSVNIAATEAGQIPRQDVDANNFAIKRVGLAVENATTSIPVPESATMLLLGIGLMSLIISGRKWTMDKIL